MKNIPALTLEESTLLRILNTELNAIEREKFLPIIGSRPLSLGFDISKACNCKCIFCLAEKGRKQTSDSSAFCNPEWMDNFETLLPFINLGIFSSYEAIINPRFDEFIHRLYRYRTPFQVFTNGKALSSELSKFMLCHGLHSLHVSMHAAKPNTYEDIMPGCKFSQTLENLMKLKHHAAKINPHFILVMVFCAMKRNIDQLMDYIILAHRLGAKVIQVNYLLVVKEHSGLEQEAMCFHPNDYNIAISSAKNKASQLGLTLNHQPMFNDQNFDKSTPCFKPWSNLAISRDGSISVCCGGSPVAGNIFETDFFTLWNNEKFQLFRKTVNSPNPPAICTSCTRGRENPWRIATHLTYMRGWTKSQIEDRLKTLGIEIPTKLVLT